MNAKNLRAVLTTSLWALPVTLLPALSPTSSVVVADSPLPGKGYFSCRDGSGRLITSDRPIPECLSREVREHNPDGSVRRVIEAPPTPEEKKAREAEQKRRQDEELRAAEQLRYDRILMSNYSSVDGIEAARARALAEPESGLRKSAERLAELADEEKALKVETEFYTRHKLPADLARKIDDNSAAQRFQHETLARRKLDISRINDRYDNERKRFLELTDSTPPRR
jgi:hypothetical protein